jgi:hypothetical protein
MGKDRPEAVFWEEAQRGMVSMLHGDHSEVMEI